MHSHHQPEAMPFWKKMLGSVPIVGSFVNPMNKNAPQKIDAALYEITDLTGQVATMYLLPVKLTEIVPFPEVSKNMDTQMNVQMGTEMAGRMWLGKIGADLTYMVVSRPVKLLINSCQQGTFTEDAKDFAVKIAQLLPLIGPFLGQDNWKKTMRNGIVGNIDQLAMLTGGTVFMMLSPYGMATDALSITVGTGLMTLGMTIPMLVKTLGNEALRKSAACLSSCSLWSKEKDKSEELVGLMAIEKDEAAKLSSFNSNPSPV